MLILKVLLDLLRMYLMLLRSLTIIFVSCTIGIFSWIYSPAALALTQIPLSNISYQNCPPEFAKGNVTSGGASMAANCFIVTGIATNFTSKTVYDADIFGRIYDANNNSVMQNRTRVGSISEVPPGKSDFKIRITVPANQPTPLKLKQFKASGFTSKVRF